MITKIEIRNFRCIASARLEPRAINLIVGPNGSGKTSILKALMTLRTFYEKGWEPFRALMNSYPATILVARGRDSTDDVPSCVIRASARLQEAVSSGKLTLGRGGSSFLKYHFCEMSPDGRTVDRQYASGRLPNVNNQRPDDMESVLRSYLLQTALVEPKYENLVAKWLSKEYAPKLQLDGFGIAGFVATKILERSGWPERVMSYLRNITPNVRDFYVHRLGEFDELTFLLTTGGIVPASEMSPGSMFAFFLACLLAEHDKTNTLLFDDIDSGLHPAALEGVHRMMRHMCAGQTSQIFATCHSPYMIDHFKADEVIVTCPLDNGMSVAAPLSRHPDFAKWNDVLSTGEFWRSVGESWVKDLPNIMEPLP